MCWSFGKRLYEFTGLIARELVSRFIVKAVFIEGCMMIIALSVNGPRGCCGEAINLLTRQLGRASAASAKTG